MSAFIAIQHPGLDQSIFSAVQSWSPDFGTEDRDSHQFLVGHTIVEEFIMV